MRERERGAAAAMPSPERPVELELCCSGGSAGGLWRRRLYGAGRAVTGLARLRHRVGVVRRVSRLYAGLQSRHDVLGGAEVRLCLQTGAGRCRRLETAGEVPSVTGGHTLSGGPVQSHNTGRALPPTQGNRRMPQVRAGKSSHGYSTIRSRRNNTQQVKAACNATYTPSVGRTKTHQRTTTSITAETPHHQYHSSTTDHTARCRAVSLLSCTHCSHQERRQLAAAARSEHVLPAQRRHGRG